MKSGTHKSPDYSIIVPVYFNQGTLRLTLDSIQQEVISRNPSLYAEIIFVDDGSRDDSLAELLTLRRENPDTVTVIKLTRNFGQCAAIMAGLAKARGNCAIIISADGQDPPSLMNDMLSAHFNDGFHIVAATRMGRNDPYHRIVTSGLFWRLMGKLSFPDVPPGGFDYVLVSDRVRRFLLESCESNPFFQGQLLWTGFPTKFIEYHRQKRKAGKSRWTLARKILYSIDGVTSYSFFPIRSLSIIGLLCACLGFLYAAVIFFTKLLWGLPVTGWAPLMITVLVLGGIQMLMLGVNGEYVWRILEQVRKRPLYIVESVNENEVEDS